LRDTLKDFLAIWKRDWFAPIDYCHYLNRKGFMPSDDQVLEVLEARTNLVRQTPSGVFERLVPYVARVPTIYLCGPINGRSDDDCTTWREQVKQLWTGRTLDPMARDYRGRELEPGIAKEIVENDIRDIQTVDGLIVFCDKPSVGTSMEVFYAKHCLQLPVVVVHPADKPSPWLIYHSDNIVKTIKEAVFLLEIHLSHMPMGDSNAS
jgi:hypothetical protein